MRVKRRLRRKKDESKNKMEKHKLNYKKYEMKQCGRVNHSRDKYCWGCGQAIDH